MSEDEAFICAVVDSPGDDTPRLVYADWLDEHDDPRGPYLREEIVWARWWINGVINSPELSPNLYSTDIDPLWLNHRNPGLDPIWVSRITRPPIGVCCDLLGLQPCDRQQSEHLSDIDRRIGIPLPIQYQAFLMNYAGGKIRLRWDLVSGRDLSLKSSVRFLYGLADLRELLNCNDSNLMSSQGGTTFLMIGESAIDIEYPVISLGPAQSGSVYIELHDYLLYDHGSGQPDFGRVTDSLGDFLNVLPEPDLIIFFKFHILFPNHEQHPIHRTDLRTLARGAALSSAAGLGCR